MALCFTRDDAHDSKLPNPGWARLPGLHNVQRLLWETVSHLAFQSDVLEGSKLGIAVHDLLC